jgi:cytochrome b561
MAIRNTTTRWGAAARFFHWAGAIAILYLLVHGYWMTHFAPRPERLASYATHASVGYALIAFMLARLLWRAANPVPALPAGSPAWERLAALAGHWGLYLLTFAAALTGWALAGTFRTPLRSFFGLFDVPALVSNTGLHKLLEETHEALAWALAALALVHVASALWHWRWRKDDVLQRML